jgi:hypothetical protein
MKKLLLFAVLIAALTTIPRAHAQGNGWAMNCISTSNDRNGTVTIENGCPFQIHYYWIPFNQPNNHYNNYLDSGSSDTFRPNGGYRLYACDAGYYVVGPDGRVITHLVDSFSCVKK